MLDSLIEALSVRGLTVEPLNGTLNVSRGTGPLASRANLDPGPAMDWLAEREEASRARDVAGWASGVHTALLEPKHSKAKQWSFVEAAGALYPTIESAGFRVGVRDASGGDPAFVMPFDGEELVVTWVMRLGRGLRPLYESQMQNWGVSTDRLVSAGRSMLFHSTRELRWKAEGDVLLLSAGDGHDAARVLVAGDVFFTEVDDNWRFAIPEPDKLLAVRSAERADALRAAATEAFARSAYPLDTRLWRIDATGPVLAG